MSPVAGYVLAYSDGSHEGPSILPQGDASPRVLYKTIEEAEKALDDWKKKIDTFLPVLYGEVYPYEKTSAREEIQKKGYAVYGWAVDEDERYGIFILEIRWA